ncbi:MAG: hypothetical protein PHO62_03370 [Sulfurimonas sp.]|uniref:hypothetical protein n=1 Tax=Sulfurimonas sp. TaxID=2022749 RepID=UPI002618AF98|nr:hypothetical protein [Sulfurimonas sp.]MDD5372451.1 hypothetical protein [Sulfurimonas sp.]
MLVFSTKIINRLSKYYNINKDDARAIVEDEWDYIEQEFVSQDSSVEDIAKELISIYMVA